MAKIKVNVDTLRDNANQVTRQIQALESLNSRLDQLLNQIEGSWTGNASEQYLATMRQHKQKTLDIIQQNFIALMYTPNVKSDSLQTKRESVPISRDE